MVFSGSVHVILKSLSKEPSRKAALGPTSVENEQYPMFGVQSLGAIDLVLAVIRSPMAFE